VTRNPYAPPNAPVADVPSPSAAPRGRLRFWVRFYLWPSGRTGRLFYWVFGFVPLTLIGVGLGFYATRTPDGLLYVAIGGLLIFWPQVVLFARRFQDINLSGLWVVPIIAFPGVLYFLDAPLPPGTRNIVNWLAAVILGVVPGTRGPNKYGSDPRGD